MTKSDLHIDCVCEGLKDTTNIERHIQNLKLLIPQYEHRVVCMKAELKRRGIDYNNGQQQT